MEIIVGKNAGFCYGVKNAVTKTEELLKKNSKIDCLGELVHNKDVIDKLEKQGLRLIKNIEEAKDKVIIRAHGIQKNIYNIAKERNIEIFDYTCPNVLKIHDIAKKYSKNNCFIFLIGNRDHPETIGTISFCGKSSYILEKEEDIETAYLKLKETNIDKLLIIVQTTFSTEKYEKMINIIKEKIDSKIELEIINTICSATRIRQEETEKISKEVDCMIIIGGKNSSNTNKLNQLAINNCPNTYLIENETELDLVKIRKFSKIGIMAGASTPSYIILKVIDVLNKINKI